MASKTRTKKSVTKAGKTARRPLPLISQFLDMPLRSWQARSCGIAALATVIEYYTGIAVPLRAHFKNARAAGAYMLGVGWRHKELAALAKHYNLSGQTFDWAQETDADAWKNFKRSLAHGPVIVSIYKDFKSKNGGHLVVASHIAAGKVFYNEPASKTRRNIRRHVSIKKFRTGWKKRIIIVTPKNHRSLTLKN